MYFTQEDYKKIETWLYRNSVKDSEFQEALPFTGKETVTIVQDGHNRKVNVKEFIEQLFNIDAEDFININRAYDVQNITLREAIALVPDKARKEGQVITFLNEEGNWGIFQFVGKLNQWNNISLWKDPYGLENFVVDSILPDEEDLTITSPDKNGNVYLSFKDRQYDPTSFSGLGRKILRKNILEVQDSIYGTQIKNVLTQADFANENTVYVIRYDFDLNNETITLPINSVLYYEGGSISNGTFACQNTTIEGVEKVNNVILTGEYEYFPAKADNEDIVNTNGILSLKDRNSTNGMGYVIIRNGKPFKSQVTLPNTIYEVRHIIDLNGENIEMPLNSTILFNGGKLINGTVVGNNTTISAANTHHIFATTLELKGRFCNSSISACWYGASNSFKRNELDYIDAFDAIQKSLDINCETGFTTVYLPFGGYYISRTLEMTVLKNIIMEGQSDSTLLKDYVVTSKLPSCACIYTDVDTPLLNIDIVEPKYYASVGTNYALCIKGGQFDVSLNSNYNSSVICFSDKNKNTNLWGVEIETTILGHPEMHRSDNNSKAILIDLQNGGYVTMLRTKCQIKYFCVGIEDTQFSNSSWATDWVDESVISTRCAIRLYSLYDARLNGSYQCVAVFYNEDGPAVIEIFSHNVVVTGKIWDFNLPVTVNGQQWKTNKYGLTIGDSSYSVTLEGIAKSLIYLNGVKGGYNQKNITPFFDEFNVLGLKNYSSLTTEVRGCVTRITDMHKPLASFGAGLISMDLTNSTIGGATITIPVKNNQYSKVLVHMSRKEGFVDSFNKVSFSLYNGSSLVYGPVYRSVPSYDSHSEDCFLVWSIPREYSRGDKLCIEFEEPIGGKYGHSGCSLYNIKASTKYEEYRESDVADVIYAANDTKPAVVLNSSKYTETQLEEMGVGKRIAYMTGTGLRLKDTHGWGVPLLCNDGFTVMGGYALPSQTPSQAIRPTLYEDMTEGKVLFYHSNGGWREYDRAKPRVKRNGVFADKPNASDIYVGFQFFCTDKQTVEGATNGIIIYHKGNNVWVDALGRVIS